MNYNEIKALHLEFTTKCQASCPMCMRTQLYDRISHNEMTLDKVKAWVPDELIARLDHVLVCGNFGDGLLARDAADIFEHLRKNNPTAFILFLTNGAARNAEFWERLARAKIAVKFAIDGLEDTHEIYRIGADWQTIINNAKTFIAAGGKARWQMISFEHNEHQIEACRKLSEELGFQRFEVRDTARFKDQDEYVVHSPEGDYSLKPTKRSKVLSKTRSVLGATENLPVRCEYLEDKRLYIGSDGVLSPCSWLECIKIYREDTIKQYNELFAGIPTLHTHSIKEILESKEFQNIYEKILKCPPAICRHSCVDQDVKRSIMLSQRKNIG